MEGGLHPLGVVGVGGLSPGAGSDWVGFGSACPLAVSVLSRTLPEGVFATLFGILVPGWGLGFYP